MLYWLGKEVAGMTEVCLELFLLDNALMSFLIIQIARLATRVEPRNWGIALACLISAVTSAFAMVNPLLLSLPAKIALSLVMTMLPFKVRTFAEWLRCTICILLSTFLVGGLAYALPNVLESGLTGGVLYADGSMRALLIALAASTLIPRLVAGVLRKKSISGYDVELRIITDYGISEMKARVDTGNLLYEAVTKLPVIVADIRSAKDSIPIEWAQGDWMQHPVKGMMLIPFKSVGGGGMMPALPAKEAYCRREGRWAKCKPSLVAFTKERINSEFGAIVNVECVDSD